MNYGEDGLFKDDLGHKWMSPEPGPGAHCQVCSLDPDQASTFWCLQAASPRPGDPAEERWALIEEWMRKTFEDDLRRCRAKALEYGSADLVIMGKAMEALLPQGDSLDHDSRERAGLEMAIGFYLMGKTARLFGAWNKAREPAEDTWHDGTIYSLMARYVRENGSWM